MFSFWQHHILGDLFVSVHVDLCCPPPPPKWDNLWDFFILITIDSHVEVLYRSLSVWIHKYLICGQLLKMRRCRDPKARGINWSLRRPSWCHWVLSVLWCVCGRGRLGPNIPYHLIEVLLSAIWTPILHLLPANKWMKAGESNILSAVTTRASASAPSFVWYAYQVFAPLWKITMLRQGYCF